MIAYLMAMTLENDLIESIRETHGYSPNIFSSLRNNYWFFDF
jgi:hypothetical protein